MSDHDKLRKNMKRASTGGPDYRATAAGKGDVNRTRGKGLTRYQLGCELIDIAAEYGQDSPEYAAKKKEWRNAQD